MQGFGAQAFWSPTSDDDDGDDGESDGDDEAPRLAA